MTTEIKELVKRLTAGRTALLRADGDRDLGFQSNITTDTSMALADELKSAIDALEAMAGKVERLKETITTAVQFNEGLTAERDRLKAALEAGPEVQVKGGDVWLQFKTAVGTHANFSVAAIAERSGPITKAALVMWCQEQIARSALEAKP